MAPAVPQSSPPHANESHPIMTRKARSQRGRSGQALVEYALTIALVAVGLTFAVLTLRNSVGNAYNATSNSLGQASACSYGVACAATTNGGAGGGNEGGSGDGNGSNGGGSGNGNNGGGNGNGNNGNGNGNGGSNGNGNTGNDNGNNGNGNGNGGGRRG